MDLDELCSKNKEFALNAVKRHGWFLQYANESLKKDKEVVLAAVNQFGLALQYAASSLKKDKEVVLAAVKKNRMALGWADGSLKKDRKFVSDVINENGRALELADKVLQEDRELILAAAVQKHSWPLHYINPSLWQDRDFVLNELKKDGSALEYAADSLKKDRDLVLTAVKQNRWALRYADKTLRKDADVILAGAREHGWALDAAHKSLWKDKYFVLKAIKENGDAFRFADKSLKSDRNFVLQVVKENGWALKYAHDSLKKDREIIQAAFANYGRVFDYASKTRKRDSTVIGAPCEELLQDSSKRIITAWSGGKDGCLSLYRTLKDSDNKLVYLLNCTSRQSGSVSFHETSPQLLKAQMELLEAPYLEKITTPDGYRDEFKEALEHLVISQGIDALVFGNIYVNEHRMWVKNVCEDVGIDDIQPIWNENTENLTKEILNSGFEAYVVCANAKLIDKEWVGRKMDGEFIKYAKSRGVDPCGEYGEFHTFVTAGPLFKGKIKFTDAAVARKKEYWVLDVNKYHVVPK
jgi:uncharacterized protein (TIGR00290 family)